jgi:predicted lipoprotein with Yx(FWY)xxD motif
MKRLRSILLAGAIPVALVALVLAGCGNSGNDNVTASAPAASATAQTGGSSGAALTVRSGDLGRFLVDGQGRTLYLFERDTGTMSTCSGGCATVWPPATTTGKPQAGKNVNAALVGSTKRSDGQSQITYNGHPLYRYTGDSAAGDTNGQDLDQFGGSWYIVSPAGKKIESDSSTSTASSGGGGMGYGY